MADPTRPARRSGSAIPTLLIGICLWLAMLGLTSVTRILADWLPGTGTFEPAPQVARVGAIFVGMGLGYAMLLALVLARLQRNTTDRGSSTGRAALTILIRVARSMTADVGLTSLTVRRVVFQIAAGIVGGLAALLAAGIITRAGTFTQASEDPRTQLTAHAMLATAAMYGFIAAPPSEEWAFRAPLLFAAAASARLRSRWACLRLPVVVTALLTASVTFGLIHAGFGALNVVTAAVSGLIWGWLALRARSIVPALVGHGLYNAVIFALQTA